MLIINAELRHNRPEAEQIVIYGHRLDDSGRKSQGLEVIIAQPYAESEIKKEFAPITTFAATVPLAKPKALDLQSSLVIDPEFRDIRFRIVPEAGYPVVAEGAYSDLKRLADKYRQFRIGASRDLSAELWVKRQLGIPFSCLSRREGFGGESFYVGRTLSLQEFLQLPTMSFDSEFMFWEGETTRGYGLEYLDNPEEDIREFLRRFPQHEAHDLDSLGKKDLVSLVERHVQDNLGNEELDYCKKPMTVQVGFVRDSRYVVHYFQHLQGSDEVRDVPLPSGETAEVHFHRSSSARGMVEELQSFFCECPPVMLITQNGMKYDLMEFRRFVERIREREKKAGTRPLMPVFKVNGTPPKIKAQAGFFQNVVTHSCMQGDFWPYAQNWLVFTPDNKLDTLMSLILCKRFRKSQGYDDLTRMSAEQMIGREASAETLMVYGVEDVVLLNQAETYLKTMIYFKSKLFARSPEDVCVTSKKSLARKQYEFRHVIERLEPPKWSPEKLKEYDDLNSAKVFDGLLDKRTTNLLKANVPRVFTDAALYYVAPFINIYWKRLKTNATVKEIMDYIKGLGIKPDDSSTRATLARFDLLHTLENYCLPYIFFERERGWHDKHGNFREYKVKEFVERFAALVNRFRPLNRSENFYCFPAEATRTAAFHDAILHVGYKIAEGKLLNIGDGSFVLSDGVSLYKRGVDVKGVYGFRTIYEKELVYRLITTALEESPDAALKLASDFVSRLRKGSLERERMIHFRDRLTRDYFDYSAPAQRMAFVKAVIDHCMMKGQKFAKVRLSDGWHGLEDFLDMPDDEVFSQENIDFLMRYYIGKRRKSKRNTDDGEGWRTLDGKLGRIIRPLLSCYDAPDDEIITHILGGTVNQLGTGQLRLF